MSLSLTAGFFFTLPTASPTEMTDMQIAVGVFRRRLSFSVLTAPAARVISWTKEIPLADYNATEGFF